MSGAPAAPAVARALPLLLWLVVGGYALFVASTLIGGYRAAARGEMPLYTDFTPRYAASLLLREGPAENLYRPRMMSEAERRTAHLIYPGIGDEQARGVGYAPWMYPPTFILVIAPLAYLPYLAAWFAWHAATAVPYLAAIRRALPARLAWPFALAAPPAFFNVMYGQTGFLTGGLIGLGLALLARHPLWAGVLIGLASVKPHFGVLIPLAFAAGGHWRAFGAAALTVLTSIAASVLAFGDEPWFGFIGTTLSHLDGFAVGAYDFHAMTSVLSAAYLAGLPLDRAWDAQGLSAAAMAGLVAWVWWRGRARPDTLGLQGAILCLATLLAVPLVYLYDLVLAVPAAAWLWADMRRRGAGRLEGGLFAAALATLLGLKAIAGVWSVQAAPLALAVLLGIALRRYHASLAPQQ